MVGTTPLVAPAPWTLQGGGGGYGGRGLTPYQQARLQLAQQKANQQRQAMGPTSVPSQPINLDAQQDQQQNMNDYGYDGNDGTSLQDLKLAPLSNGGGNSMPMFAQNAPTGHGNPAGYSPAQVAQMIMDKAPNHGVDPTVAYQVARSEGLNQYTGDGGSSFGPFQLHYGNVAGGGNRVGGLGDTFTKQTGLDARDPSTVPAQIDFALDQAKAGGWGPWHGWKGAPDAGLNANVPLMQKTSDNDVPLPPQRPTDLPQQTAQADDNSDQTDPTSGLSWLL